MRPGGLRALEFDRIVAAVRSFALTPTGAARLDALTPADRAAAWSASCWPRRRRRCATWPTTRSSRCGHRKTSRICSACCRSKAARSSRAPARAGRLPRVDRDVRRGGPPSRRRSSRACARWSDRAPSFTDEIGDVRRKIASPGDVLDSRQPAAGVAARSAAQAAHAPAQHARVVPARQGHVEVPAGPGRHRAQRPLRPAREGRASQRRCPGSCTAAHRAARRCTWSRCDGRDQQRPRGARSRRGRRSPADPAGADRSLPRPRRRRRGQRGSRDRARRAAGKGPARRDHRRRRAGACRRTARLELLAARHPLLMRGVVSRYADDVSGLPERRHRWTSNWCRRRRRCSSRGRTPAARPSR